MLQTSTVECLKDFWSEIASDDLFAETMLYRGQVHRRNLLPAVARNNPRLDTTAKETAMLNEFRRIGALRLRGHDLDTLSVMILAQHYGLKTRLLDWTSNPLVALWFACSSIDSKPGDAYVYASDACNHMADNHDLADPFKISKTMVLRPKLNNERIVAQHGWFTLHRYSEKLRKFNALEEMESGDLSLHWEYKIPAGKRLPILRELDRCGINHSTLQPDLAGLCNFLNYRHDYV